MQNIFQEKEEVIKTLQKTRARTMELCQPLENEDFVIQCSKDVSPIKWHLGHTTWFFETFILNKFLTNYKNYAQFQNIFNSYYYCLPGSPYPKVKRGYLSRPTVNEILKYREHMDHLLLDFIQNIAEKNWEAAKALLILGMQHEEQHQELLLMDIKYNFSLNPLWPIYRVKKDKEKDKRKAKALGTIASRLGKNNNTATKSHSLDTSANGFYEVAGGTIEIGHRTKEFCFDNELPRHKEILKPYQIARKLTTNAEYLAFIEDKGYQTAKWWLAEGFETLEKNNWQAPLYWQKIDNKWFVFTLSGLKPLNLAEPVAHISYFEADAYANWSGSRLATESEWEHFVASQKITSTDGNFLENGLYHPRVVSEKHEPLVHEAPQKTRQETDQFFGDLWEWTASAYTPYPGFKPLPGEVSEYNGKFMSGQMVLKGGSCLTPKDHIRASYRNYFQPNKRWQFAGIRLAKDIS